MPWIFQSLLAMFIFEQKLPTLYISQIILEVKFHFLQRDVFCSAAVGNYTYFQHPARCRQTQSQSPLTQEMLFLPSSSGTPSLWHLAHLLFWCWLPVAHNLFILTCFLIPCSLVLLQSHPGFFSFFFISYSSFKPPGRIDLTGLCK